MIAHDPDLVLAQVYLDRIARAAEVCDAPPHAYKLLPSYAQRLEEALDDADDTENGEHARQAAFGYLELMEKTIARMRSDLRAPAFNADGTKSRGARQTGKGFSVQSCRPFLEALRPGPVAADRLESLTGRSAAHVHRAMLILIEARMARAKSQAGTARLVYFLTSEGELLCDSLG